MKSSLIGMMTAMMPFMKPLVWLALAAFLIGVVAALVRADGARALSRVALWVLAIIGVFFVLAQLMGMWLGAQPSINFGDPKKFEFILVPFWQLGLVMLAGAVVLFGIQRWRQG